MPTVVVLALRTRLTAVLHPEATAVELLGAVSATKPRLILDMRGIAAMDCSGLGFLATLHRVAGERGGALRIFGLQDRARRLVELCGLLRVLQNFGSEELALADLADREDDLYLERAPARPCGRRVSTPALRVSDGPERFGTCG